MTKEIPINTSKAEYDEISPITGELSVLVEDDPATGLTSKLCMQSGYTTNEAMISGSAQHQHFLATTPKLLHDLSTIDENGLVWFPITIYTEHGIFFPDGTDVDNWIWRIAPIVNVLDEEKEQYPVPNKPGEFYERRLAIDKSIWYDSQEFDQAFAKFYDILRASNENENQSDYLENSIILEL